MQSLREALEGLDLSQARIATDEEVDRRDRAERAQDCLVVLSCVPAALRKKLARGRMEKAVERRLLAAARAWRADRSFVVLGPTGAGKSTAAAWLLQRIVALGVRDGGDAWRRAKHLAWYPAVELERARAEHRMGAGDAPEILKAQAATVLVLDDAGQEHDPSAVREVLAARYDLGVPTIATSNATPAQLSAHYGDAFVRKLLESGPHMAVVVNLLDGGRP
jgi:DNA replication protein DnaC